LLGGALFCGGALILQTTQTGGLPSFDAARSMPTAHTALQVKQAVPALASCASNQGTVTDRAFAFDGTVLATRGRPDLVTFRVHRWYAGGHRRRITVEMAVSPRSAAWNDASEYPPPHSVGTRLLVSGEPRWGGPPLRDPYAWACGFTVPYQPAEAASWRVAFLGSAKPGRNRH
jgi:hypothetical protein